MVKSVRSARLLSIAAALLLVAGACGGPAQSPGTGASPAGTAAGSPLGSPDTGTSPDTGESPDTGASPDTGESPDTGASPGGSPAGELPGGFSGDIFAYGVTYTQGADEIGTERIDYYRELNPDVNLTFSESDYTPEGFLTAMQSGDPPDVLRVDRAQIAALAARDLLMPLDQCFADMGVDPASTYYEGPLNQVTIDGEIYAAPEFLTTVNWFVNGDVWTEAGLDPANFNFGDWEALRSANEQLLQNEGGTLTRIGIDPKLPEYLPLWVHANGGQLISDDGMTATFDTPEVAEALQFGVDLINAHGGRDPFLDFRQTFNPFGITNQWATNKAAAHPYEQFFLNVLLGVTTEVNGELQWSTTPGDEGATPDPSVPADAAVNLQFAPFVDRQGNPMTFATGQGLAVTSASSDPEAACAWVVTMTSEEAWARAAEERRRLREESGQYNTATFPANSVASERIWTEIADIDALPEPFASGVRVVLENQQNSFALPPTPGASAIFQGEDSIMAQAVARVLDGEPIDQVLAETQAEAQAAIDEAQ